MGQVRHGSDTTTHAVGPVIQLRQLRFGTWGTGIWCWYQTPSNWSYLLWT